MVSGYDKGENARYNIKVYSSVMGLGYHVRFSLLLSVKMKTNKIKTTEPWQTVAKDLFAYGDLYNNDA